MIGFLHPSSSTPIPIERQITHLTQADIEQLSTEGLVAAIASRSSSSTRLLQDGSASEVSEVGQDKERRRLDRSRVPGDFHRMTLAELRLIFASQGLLSLIPAGAVKADVLRLIEREMYDQTEAEHEGVTLLLQDSAGGDRVVCFANMHVDLFSSIRMCMHDCTLSTIIQCR